MTGKLIGASWAMPESKFEELCQEAWSILLDGQQLGLDQLCALAGRPATDPAIRLSTIQELLFYICAGVWKPQSAEAKQALPVVCSFLRALGDDRKAHNLSRVRAIAFLLKGIQLGLWSTPPEVYSQIGHYIEQRSRSAGRSFSLRNDLA
jgi:hypothetical protein